MGERVRGLSLGFTPDIKPSSITIAVDKLRSVPITSVPPITKAQCSFLPLRLLLLPILPNSTTTTTTTTTTMVRSSTTYLWICAPRSNSSLTMSVRPCITAISRAVYSLKRTLASISVLIIRSRTPTGEKAHIRARYDDGGTSFTWRLPRS